MKICLVAAEQCREVESSQDPPLAIVACPVRSEHSRLVEEHVMRGFELKPYERQCSLCQDGQRRNRRRVVSCRVSRESPAA